MPSLADNAFVTWPKSTPSASSPSLPSLLLAAFNFFFLSASLLLKCYLFSLKVLTLLTHLQPFSLESYFMSEAFCVHLKVRIFSSALAMQAYMPLLLCITVLNSNFLIILIRSCTTLEHLKWCVFQRGLHPLLNPTVIPPSLIDPRTIIASGPKANVSSKSVIGRQKSQVIDNF